MSTLLLCTLGGDTVFSDLSYSDALQHAHESGRTLILYFASTSDPASQHMEETSWRSSLVVDWARQDGLVLRLEAEKNESLAEAHGVQRLPTLLWLQDGTEMKRRHGDVPPSSLISWLHTPPGKLQSIEDLQRIFDDTLAHPYTRISARELLADRLEPEQTLQHYLWLWNEGATIFPNWTTHRRGLFAMKMSRLARRYPPAANAFAELYEAAEAAVLGRTTDEDAWLDWLALGSSIDRSTELAKAIQELLMNDGSDTFVGGARMEAKRICQKRGDLAAVGLLTTDAESAARGIVEVDEAQMREMYESVFGAAGHKYIGPFDDGPLQHLRDGQRPERVRTRITTLFEPLLVAGRTQGAVLVANVLLDNLDDCESRLALVEAAFNADDYWRSAASGEDAFSQYLAGFSRPLSQMRVSLEAYLADASRLATSMYQKAEVESLLIRLEHP